MRPNILVVRLSSLGDVVLTAPVYRNLKAFWPDCRITVLVKPALRAALEGHPCVDAVMPFDGLLSTLSRIRKAGFTHLLDLHGTLRSRLLSSMSGIPRRLRYRKDALARRLFVLWGRPAPALAKHTIDRYLECLAAWKVPTPHRGLELGDSRAASSPSPAGARILIVQTAFLGDATLTVPLARALKEALPAGRVAVLARPDCAEIFRGAPWVDEVVADDKRGRHSGPMGLWRLSRELAGGGHQVAVVPHRSLRSALAVRLAGIPRRVGFSASAGSFLFTDAIPFSWGMHDLDRNLSLLLPLVGASAPPSPVYLAGGGARATIDARLAAARVSPSERLVGVHPGSVWPTKRWPIERFAALVARLGRETGAKTVLVGGAGDAALAAEIAGADGVETLDWTGKTTLPELIALMGRLSLFVTNDSGPMHVATACGVPTLAFFGPTTRELGFFPYGPGHRVLEADLECRPCGLHGAQTCPAGHFLCMRLLTVDAAFRAAEELLSHREAASAR